MISGGAFLNEEIRPEQVFIPEQLDGEARLMARTMEDFVRQEVLPQIASLEVQEEDRMRGLLQKAGVLGLLGGSIPERFDGLGLPKTTLALLTEKAAPYLSFAISQGIASGVALLPLLFFGTEKQKQMYLPRMASGEWIGAFALSEANAGSDALGAQTRATLEADGTAYRLTGEKMWTTNGGFADLFIVFAQVDGQGFTAFVVEKETPGLTPGREEHKMGLRGSSTRRVLFQDARVPVENVIGAVGKGHLPALYALNVGRFSIAATALGASKECLRLAAQYAKQRVQFGKPLTDFGLVQQKLANMAARIYLLESMIYRVAGYWDAHIGGANTPEEAEEKFRQASEEYALECALLKFYGTEVFGFVADEAVQLHGGFGYSEEFPIARMYRDARVFRIVEGTNEINRLAILDQLLRRMEKGRFDWNETQTDGTLKVGNADSANALPVGLLQIEHCLSFIRQSARHLLECGKEREGKRLKDNQVFAACFADILAALFALESGWLRACCLHFEGTSPDAAKRAESTLLMVQTAAEDARIVAYQAARRALSALDDGSKATNINVSLLTELALLPLPNSVANGKHLAAVVTEQEGYPL